MDRRIVRKEGFSVIGRLGQGPSKFGQVWIRPLWRDLQEEFEAIVHLARRGAGGEVAGMWGLMSDARDYLAPWGVEGRYLAGCEANPGVSPPRGWTLWHIPEQTYLVLSCPRGRYQELYESTLGELADSRRYRLAGAVHEYYPPDRPGEIDLYFPLEHRREALEAGFEDALEE